MNPTPYNDPPITLPDALPTAAGNGAAHAATLAHRGWEALREGTHQLGERARHASDGTADYIRHEPMKSVLVAAAGGALLAMVLTLLVRDRSRR